MNSKSIGLQILWWSEIVLSMRVLLFTVPVLLHKWSGGEVADVSGTDSFVMMISICAGMYFFVGVLSILGNHQWKVFHLSAAFVVFLLSGYFLYRINSAGGAVLPGYFIPALFAAVSVVLANRLKISRKTVS